MKLNPGILKIKIKIYLKKKNENKLSLPFNVMWPFLSWSILLKIFTISVSHNVLFLCLIMCLNSIKVMKPYIEKKKLNFLKIKNSLISIPSLSVSASINSFSKSDFSLK